MDLSEDGKTLYIVSLATKKLYSIFINNPFEIPDAADVDSIDIPDPIVTEAVAEDVQEPLAPTTDTVVFDAGAIVYVLPDTFPGIQV